MAIFLYEECYNKLKDLGTLVGISVWCQTGGWARWRDLTFIENSSKTNELNTYATIRIFKDGISANSALESFLGNDEMTNFYRKYCDIFLKLLYIDGFSNIQLYFRRIRISPLIWIYWGYVTVTPFMKFAHRFLGGKNSHISYNEINEILTLGEKLGIEDIEFHYKTLRLIAHCREALLGKAHEEGLISEIRGYKQYYPDKYNLTLPHYHLKL